VSRAERTEDLASQWVMRREEPSWSPADQAELDEWLSQSDANKVAYWRLDHGWREADRIASLGAPLRPASTMRLGLTSWKPLALAAAVLAAFTIFLLQLPGLLPGGSAQAGMERFETPIGGHKLVTLVDGSRIELNTQTAIQASVNDRVRSVWLQRGEAFFSVAKHQGQKFVIYAGPRTVTVLGTKFSVRRSGNDVVVAVLEGRVQVETSQAGAGQKSTLTSGEVAIARDRETLIAQSPSAVQQQLAWRAGMLELEGTTLAAAAAQFNRYNPKQLVIEDPEAARTIIAGSFVARNVDAFARLLEDAYGLDANDSAGRIIVSSRRLANATSPKSLGIGSIQSAPRSQGGIARQPCEAGHRNCALIPLSPPLPQTQVAMLPDKKAIQDANNWDVIHKLYPPRALAAREEGLVGFMVEIDSSGSPTRCKITHTSGHPLLDLETCQLIMMHATFNRPAGSSPSQKRSYEGVVNWKLPNAPQIAAPVPPKAIAETTAPEQLVCKRIPRTGSIAGFERKCMSKSDWERASSESRTLWDQLQGIGSEGCEGPQCK